MNAGLRDSLAQVQELKPCPFCGGQPKVGETNTGVPGMEDCGYAFVECCIVHAHSEESIEDAIEKWNTRHGDADRSAELTTAWMAGVERERDRAARDAEAWLSIESAPFADLQHTHPTDCLVWSPKIGGVRLGRVWRYPDGEPCGQAVGYSGEWEITHWRPLPAPPTNDAARAGERG